MSEYDDMCNVMIESNNLGILFCRQGRYQMAMMFHLQALRIAEAVWGKLSKDYCDCLYNLGNTCADAGDFDIALKYLFAAEQNTVARGATDDINWVHLLNSIGYALEGAGDYPAAISHLESALGKLRGLGSYGELHEDLPRNLYYLAGVCEKAGALRKAQTYYEEVLSMLCGRQSYYPTCLNSLAHVLAALGEFDRSLALRVEAIGQIRSAIGPTSISYAQCLRNLAVIYHSRGDCEKATALMREAVEIKRALLGQSAKETIREDLLLIEFYAASKDTEAALELFFHVLNALDADFEGRDEILHELAKLYLSLGDINRLNDLYNRAIEMSAETPADDEDA